MNRTNRPPVLALAALAVAGALSAGTPARAALIFSDPSANSASGRDAGESPLSHITVAAPTVIDQIAVLVDLDSAGNLKFVIYDRVAASFVLITGPQAFTDDGATFKLSNTFAPVTLLPTGDYSIGAIADVGGQWSYLFPPSPVTQNGITNQGDNGNVINFANPTIDTNGSAQIPIQLYGPDAAAVPEPATLTAACVGLASLAGYGWRRRRPAAG